MRTGELDKRSTATVGQGGGCAPSKLSSGGGSSGDDHLGCPQPEGGKVRLVQGDGQPTMGEESLARGHLLGGAGPGRGLFPLRGQVDAGELGETLPRRLDTPCWWVS